MHRRSISRVAPPEAGASPGRRNRTLVHKHLAWAWWSLLAFLSLGVVLEALHGFKVPLYLDVSTQTRRLMWTLAHAHGAVLALVHAAFAFTLGYLQDRNPRRRAGASLSLTLAGILIPAGFLLGGAFIHEGDPGMGIALVPVGAACLLIAVALTAGACLGQAPPEEPPQRPELKIVRITPEDPSNDGCAG